MDQHKNAIKLGLIWGGIAIATTLLLYLIGMLENPFAGVLIFVFGIYMMYRSGKEKRDELGGYLSWKQALTPIWLTSVVSSLLTTLFTWILFRFIDPGLQEQQREQAIKMTEKMRSLMGDSAAEGELERLESHDFASFSNYVYLFFWSLIIYFIIAAIIALVIRKKNAQDIFTKF
ncbi:MAG: DUF4199 domain-containing protein [Saprospiraceae bacterium]|nr:DUF4199 domain-containing protein [Saprospiraceae bacterium]MBK8448971.1 DUF4199 domain-containing protein [Saprospiraceae bacterium]MBK9223215.1 DUF4199 domain-containing protein [Saprospiraceae bacterium]MBK9720745.1 DUF4199 domain-containing protein [Saprospiraceae bacterium]